MTQLTALPDQTVEAYHPVERASRSTGMPERKRAARRAEEREYRITLALFFVLFLPVALVARMLPPTWRPFSGCRTRRSNVGDARAAAHEVTPFVFMR